MTAIGGGRALLVAQKGFKRDLTALLRSASDRMTGIVLRSAGPDGKVRRQNETTVVNAIGTTLERVFVAADGRSSIDERGQPLSPFARLLLGWLGWEVREIVRAHRTYMQRVVPADVQAWLTARPRRPVREQTESELEALRDRYADLRIFHPNPLAEDAFDPRRQWVRPDRWQGPDGYRLSDRIWRVDLETRRKVDSFVLDAIRSGDSAVNLSRRLEQFLLPGRAPIRTERPYGIDASFDALRLARSEISRVHGQAAWMSAYLNPYVAGMDWALSASHPRIDICDSLATIGMGGGRIKPPYPMTSAPLIVSSSHPQCICTNIPAVTDSPAAVTARLRAAMEEARALHLEPFMTPLQGDAFVEMLLGEALNGLLRQIGAAQLALF